MTDFPAPMDDAAFVGPIGAAVRKLEPQVETCREALLAETLLFFGNAIGRTAHMQVTRTRHHSNEFAVLVGQSSRARKGTVRDAAVDLVTFADPAWGENGVLGGATSGEGIISAVRDPVTKRRRATKEEKKDIALTHEIDGDGYIVEIVDAGVGDKRVVFDEAELSAVFKVATRDGNTLSERFRKFYDKGEDRIVNKNSPIKATNAHVSINGHITREELRARLTELDAANGWANRFIYFATRRVRRLPGHAITDYELLTLAGPLGDAIAWAREHEPAMAWTETAWKRWCRFYANVPDEVDGIIGALTARAESHVMRLALTFAVADQSRDITLRNLEAALAVWDYAERSVAWAWEGMIGNADAERILRALHDAGKGGLSRTAIRDLFSHDRRAGAIDAGLRFLEERGLVVRRMVPTGGRPALWFWDREFVEEDPPGPNGTESRKDDAYRESVPFGPAPSYSGEGGHG